MARGEVQTRFVVGKVKAKGTLYGSLFGLFASVLIGCGTTESNTNTVAVNTGPNLNAQKAAIPGSANTTLNGTNSFNTARPMDAQIQKMEEMRKAANRAGKTIPSLNSRPAPEDSTMTTTLTDRARETRTWKKHPVLAKVEKIYDGESSIKVYLRNGKVIELPGNAIGKLDQIPAASVLEIAGVSAPAAADQKHPRRNTRN